jgi:hypothetical protein
MIYPMQPEQDRNDNLASLPSDQDRVDAAEQLMQLAERFLERRDVSNAVVALELAEGIVAERWSA